MSMYLTASVPVAGLMDVGVSPLAADGVLQFRVINSTVALLRCEVKLWCVQYLLLPWQLLPCLARVVWNLDSSLNVPQTSSPEAIPATPSLNVPQTSS